MPTLQHNTVQLLTSLSSVSGRRLTTLPGLPGTPRWSSLHHQNLRA